MAKKLLHNLFFALIALSLGACAGLETRRDIEAKSERSRVYEEGLEARAQDEDGGLYQEPLSIAQDSRVAVVLGPGAYKSFAHAGVIKELRKAQIPIHKVVGIEWGALVGGVYSLNGQFHEMDWKLYKLEREELSPGRGGLFRGRDSHLNIESLESYLSENLTRQEISNLTVDFECPSLNIQAGVINYASRGPIFEVVRDCMSYPPRWRSGRNQVAGLFSTSEILNRLKNQGYDIIILVNVLGDGQLLAKEDIDQDESALIMWQEARRSLWQAKSLATDVIEVNTRAHHLYDFEGRRAMMRMGEQAGKSAAQRLVRKYRF